MNLLIKTVFAPERKRRGQGLVIRTAWSESAYGPVLTGATDRGVCWIGFTVNGDKPQGFEKLYAHFPAARFIDDPTLDSGLSQDRQRKALDLYGTVFQLHVWEVLVNIARGQTRTYKDIAAQIGAPAACRAVGSAVGANPVSILVPCHRVLPATGVCGHYGWGAPLKRRLLEEEGAIVKDAS